MTGALTGQVLSASRRFIQIRDSVSGEILLAKSATKALEISVGDYVTFYRKAEDYVVDTIAPRENVLERQYLSKRKVLASNVDLLLIVSATIPLFNARFVDRIAAVSTFAGISFTIVVNKVDLGISETEPLLEPYRRLNIPLIVLSAKSGQGFSQIEDLLSPESIRTIALAGISGVGKTTILNRLIPETDSRTGEVSSRTGQGRQTTSQPQGYLYSIHDGPKKLVIDLPGLSSYGITFLTPMQVRNAFPEFEPFFPECRYSDCSHTSEPDCAVKEAIARGEISSSRYDSYLDILNEIEEARPY